MREIKEIVRVESCFTNIFLALIKEYMQYTKGCQNLKEKNKKKYNIKKYLFKDVFLFEWVLPLHRSHERSCD